MLYHMSVFAQQNNGGYMQADFEQAGQDFNITRVVATKFIAGSRIV